MDKNIIKKTEQKIQQFFSKSTPKVSTPNSKLAPTWSRLLPAKMWRRDVGDVDVVDATEERRSDDHQYEHESKNRRKKKIFLIKPDIQILLQRCIVLGRAAATYRIRIKLFDWEKFSYLIMSSIIFPMDICSVPSDSWAGRM